MSMSARNCAKLRDSRRYASASHAAANRCTGFNSSSSAVCFASCRIEAPTAASHAARAARIPGVAEIARCKSARAEGVAVVMGGGAAVGWSNAAKAGCVAMRSWSRMESTNPSPICKVCDSI